MEATEISEDGLKPGFAVEGSRRHDNATTGALPLIGTCNPCRAHCTATNTEPRHTKEQEERLRHEGLDGGGDVLRRAAGGGQGRE